MIIVCWFVPSSFGWKAARVIWFRRHFSVRAPDCPGLSRLLPRRVRESEDVADLVDGDFEKRLSVVGVDGVIVRVVEMNVAVL